MRVVAPLCLAAALVVGTPAMAQRSPSAGTASFARFERSVAATKKAMMSDPQAALRQADATAVAAGRLPPTRQGRFALATARWLQGEAHMFLNEPEQATPLITDALAIVERVGRGTKLHGDLLRSRGAIAAIGGRIQDALGNFQRAYDIFTKLGETRSRAMALQDIGHIYGDAEDFTRAVQYYAQSAEVFDQDPVLLLTSHNDRADALRKLGREGEAESEYRAALQQARVLGSPLLQVRILSNLAAVQIDSRRLPAANATIDRALAMTSSGEAAGWKPFVLGTAAMLARARGDLPRAATFLDRTFAGMNLSTTQMPFKEFHQTAADVYERQGDESRALAHLKAYQRLEGEARALTASTSAQLMSARFDFANQNLKIYQLKQGQLQRDVQLEREHTRFRTFLLGGSLGAGGLVLVLLVVGMLSLRRSRNQTRAANVELTRALKAKTEFLATTSHEIRTPLNGILGMTQVLLTDTRIQGDIRGRIEVVQGAGETMRALVDDILDVAKMETGQLVVADEPTPLAKILRDAASLWSAHAGTKGLSVTLEADDAPDRIMSDETRLRQVIFNLMSNAVKFTERGGITLSARACRREEGEVLELSVADTGIGIRADQQALVFEAFHQVDGSTVRQFSGTGLGLSICRRLVEALGGAITLVSTPGEGTCFTVRLPLRLIEVREVEAPESRVRAASLAEARVLVVEANPLTRGMIGALIEPHALLVKGVASGTDALAALAAGSVDHLLVEAKSAGGDPVAALRQITEAARERDVHLSVLFAPSDDLPASEIVSIGASQIILKPIGGKALMAAMAQPYAIEPASLAAAEQQAA